jgi:hypothetical protein
MAGMVEKRRWNSRPRVSLREKDWSASSACRPDLLNARPCAVWPGITGSIAHSHTRAWVALVDSAFGTVGIDRGPTSSAGMSGTHVRDDEVASRDAGCFKSAPARACDLLGQGSAIQGAVPALGSFMDYKALRVGSATRDCCVARSTRRLALSKGFVVHGRWLDGDSLVTAMWIPAR